MDIRSQIVRDCVLLGDFAVKSVETMRAGDEKGVVKLYTGASQANVLMLLATLVEDLAKCASPEDFPGDCPEVRRMRNYSLCAFQGLLERAGNPADAGREFVLGAQLDEARAYGGRGRGEGDGTHLPGDGLRVILPA